MCRDRDAAEKCRQRAACPPEMLGCPLNSFSVHQIWGDGPFCTSQQPAKARILEAIGTHSFLEPSWLASLNPLELVIPMRSLFSSSICWHGSPPGPGGPFQHPLLKATQSGPFVQPSSPLAFCTILVGADDITSQGYALSPHKTGSPARTVSP